ncbi:MAG: hypothetical protein LAT62_00840 [Natronospirillum sp.]|uniref:hypothetical protein n=1 Tax=Natronospirillum sp. TaxID=2812955 RepID=UPI0025E4B869|nr:hypothetical protein [Natronospirillum sp.]MCH8550449.1 hypothetical protein [Natronospirillum sp.]
MIGILSIVFQNRLPAEDNILTMNQSIGLTLLGGLLIYVGRQYLAACIGFIMSSDGKDSGD